MTLIENQKAEAEKILPEVESGTISTSSKVYLIALLPLFGLNISFCLVLPLLFLTVIPVSSFAQVLGNFGFPAEPGNWFGLSDAVLMTTFYFFLAFWVAGALLVVIKRPVMGLVVGTFLPLFITVGIVVSTSIVLSGQQAVTQNKEPFLKKYSGNVLFLKCDTTYPVATTTVKFTISYAGSEGVFYQTDRAVEKGEYCRNIYIQCDMNKESCQRDEKTYHSVNEAKSALRDEEQKMINQDRTVITVTGNFSEKFDTQQEKDAFLKKWWEVNKDKDAIELLKSSITNGLMLRNGQVLSSDSNLSSKLLSSSKESSYDKVYTLQFFDAGNSAETVNPYFSNYSTYVREYIYPYLDYAKLPSIYISDFEKPLDESINLGIIASRIYICPGNFSSLKTDRQVFGNCYFDTVQCTPYGCDPSWWRNVYYGQNVEEVPKSGSSLVEEDITKSLFLTSGEVPITSFHGSVVCDKNNSCAISRKMCKKRLGPSIAECSAYADKIVTVKNEEELTNELESIGLYFSGRFSF